MIFILDLLTKIQWDKKENPEDYTICYFNISENNLKELKFDKIKEINKLFIIFEKGNKEFQLPVHRIREVRKDKEIVWKREEGSTLMGEAI
ncbi:DUF504 domain-containing protein [Candidatus Woesearchaeota archaeon]|nr:DUF504 domain-containing protein [Candidatus Woesearchaeota archaeon]